MKKRFVSLVALAVFLYSLLLAAIAGPETMYSNMNPNLVKNSPPTLKVLTLKADSRPIRVSQLSTYHWNNGRGALPGTISIWENGKQLGAWKAEGRSGSGANNVYWIVYPNITLWPGHKYEIHDSDVATWSWNEASGNCGMFELQGTYMAQAPKTKKKEKKQTEQPKAQPAASSNGWNLVYCKTTRQDDDPRITAFKHTENDGYVRYFIEYLDGGKSSAVYNASCTIPPSSVSPGQQIILELKINMKNAKIRDKDKGTWSFWRSIWCSWDPKKNKNPYNEMAGNLESVNPGHDRAKVVKGNNEGVRNISQDKTKLFYRFPQKKTGGISIYFLSFGPCGMFVTEFRYE